MSSTLSEGVRVPDIGSVNWGADVNFNWGLLNTALANISGNVKTDVANTWTATQTFSETISGSIDGVAARAVGDEDGTNIKTALAGKQPSLSQSQLDAVNSGVTAAAVQQIGTNASNISGLQTAVASKAADDQVVHLAGAETITGNKTWTGLNTFQYTVIFKDATAISAGGFGVGLNFYDYEGNRYGYILPHVTPDGTKNIVFTNTAGGYLELASFPVPYASGVLSLGTNALRWNGIYDANSVFVYNGYTFGTAPTGNRYWGLWCRDNAGAEVVNYLACALKSGVNTARIRCLNTDGINTYDRDVNLNVSPDGTTHFSPGETDVYDLGRATLKWKTLNGINPGALSIPNLSASSRVDISGNMVADSYGNIKFTPQIYGWVYIDFNVTSATITSGTEMYVQAKNNSIANTDFAINFMRPTDSYHVFVWMPVWANKQIILQINFSGFSVGKAYIYPCLGNV